MKRFIFIVMCLMTLALSSSAQKKSDTYRYLHRAEEIYFSEDPDYEKVESLLDLQILSTPRCCDALYLRANCYRRAEMWQEAIDDFTAGIKYFNKKNSGRVRLRTFYWGRALTYEELEDSRKAEEDFNKTIALMENDPAETVEDLFSVYSARGRFYGNLEQFELSNADFQHARELMPSDPYPLLYISLNQLYSGNLTGALATVNSVFQDYEDCYVAHHVRALVYESMGEPQRAIDDFLTYLLKSEEYPDQDDIERYFSLDPDYVLKCLDEIIGDEQTLFWQLIRCEALALKCDFKPLIDEYLSIVEQYPDWELYDRLADCYEAAGAYELAILARTKCIEMNEDRHALVSRAGGYCELGQFDKAIEDYQMVIDANRFIATLVYRQMGFVSMLARNDEAAMNYFNMGIDFDFFGYSGNYLMRGRLNHKFGNLDEAKADFEKVLELTTDDQTNSDRYYALHYLGRDDEALQLINEIIESDPENAGYYYDLACLYCLMGRYQDAFIALEKSLSMGYKKFGHIAHDFDLDPIRDFPEFKELVEKYKQQHDEFVSTLAVPQF